MVREEFWRWCRGWASRLNARRVANALQVESVVQSRSREYVSSHCISFFLSFYLACSLRIYYTVLVVAMVTLPSPPDTTLANAVLSLTLSRCFSPPSACRWKAWHDQASEIQSPPPARLHCNDSDSSPLPSGSVSDWPHEVETER